MTRIFFVLLVSAFFLPAVSGQSNEENWIQHVIAAKDRSFDFQTVAKGAIPEHRFVLKNPLQEPLHIASVTSSCTCTTVDFDLNKTTLQTYEELVITARLRADMYDGQRIATITVFIDKPNRAEIQLNVRGDVRSDLRVTPNYIDFGNVKPKQEPSRTLTVTYTGSNSQWRIVDARCDNGFIRAEIAAKSLDYGRKVFEVKVTLDKSAPQGSIGGLLFLITNDTASRREIPIPLQAVVGTVLTTSPPTLFLGALQPGEPSPKRMAILSGTEPFRITKIECDNPAVETEYTIDPDAPAKGRHFIPVLYKNPVEGDGSPKEGMMMSAVRITTDIPGLVQTFYVTSSVRKKEEEKEEAEEETALEP